MDHAEQNKARFRAYNNSEKGKARRAQYRKGPKYRLVIAKCQRALHKKRTEFVGTLKFYFGGCMDCGFNGAPEALDFDHRPGEKKLFPISRSWTLPWYRVLTEMSKCDLVCANCHRIRTTCRNRAKDLI